MFQSSYSYDASDIVLGVNSANIGYLRYIHLENIFDSGSVNYLFGEVRINSANTKAYIPVVTRIGE